MATARVLEQGLLAFTSTTARVLEQGVSTYSSTSARVIEQGASATIVAGATAQVIAQGVRAGIPHHMIMMSDLEWHPATLYRATADTWI